MALDKKGFHTIETEYKKYLDMSKEYFEQVELKIANKEIPQIAKDNKIINKIKVIYWLEDLFKIKRYQLTEIKCDNLESIKEIVLSDI